jgi:hypothetical protein
MPKVTGYSAGSNNEESGYRYLILYLLGALDHVPVIRGHQFASVIIVGMLMDAHRDTIRITL